MAEIKVDIRPSGVLSAIVYAPFNEALETLNSNAYQLISTQEQAKLRIQNGNSHSVSQNDNWVREGIIYTPNGKPKLVRNSPILEYSTEATKSHRSGNEWLVPKGALEKALTDSVDFPEKNIEIPTKRFGDEALTVYVFDGENEAKAYGEFLKDAGIKNMPVYAVDKAQVDKQSGPFSRQLWFAWLGSVGRSYLVGDGYLHIGNSARGVRSSVSATGANGVKNERAQNSELYAPEKISLALSELGFSGLEAQLLKTLRK